MKIIKAIINEIIVWGFSLISCIPGRIGIILRRLAFAPFFKKCGKKFAFAPHIDIHGFKNITFGENASSGPFLRLYASGGMGEEIVFGNNVAFNHGVTINADCGGRIIVGDNVYFGPNVYLRASNHYFEKKDILINQQGHTGGIIKIEDDVWIAANAVILPGVTIKKGAVIAAGAVVTKDIESYKVVAGVPAKVISERK